MSFHGACSSGRTCRIRSIWVFAAALALGCGSKEDVTLTAKIQNPKAMPVSVALGTALNGSFDLVLEVGSYSPHGSSVTPGTLAIRNEAAVLVSSLAVDYSETPPFEVGVGKSKTVAATLDATKLLEASALDALCAADVWYVLSFTDTSSAMPSTTQSAKFAASCP